MEEFPSRRNLLDKETRKKLPKLYETEGQGLEAQALVKFFSPDTNWIWYATEFDGKDLFFGLVIGHEIELGYFSLSELEQADSGLGLRIERDQYFEACTLSSLKALHGGHGDEHFDATLP